MFAKITVVLLLIGFVSCQNEIPEDIQKGIEEKLSEIPGLENFNRSAIPQVEDVVDVIKKKCEKNGGSEAFDKLGPAKDEMQECFESNFNTTQIEIEIAEARKSGSMEVVFAKYCAKKHTILQCISNLTDVIEPCLEEKERVSLKVLQNITENMAEFFCYKDGDRVAMFIAEGGFECIQSRKEGLETCINTTLAHRIPEDVSLTNLPLFIIDEEGCQDYNNVQKCVVDELEKCTDSTPANIIDALFKFVRRITPCKDYKPPQTRSANKRNSSSAQDVSFILMSIVSLLYFAK